MNTASAPYLATTAGAVAKTWITVGRNQLMKASFRLRAKGDDGAFALQRALIPNS